MTIIATEGIAYTIDTRKYFCAQTQITLYREMMITYLYGGEVLLRITAVLAYKRDNANCESL